MGSIGELGGDSRRCDSGGPAGCDVPSGAGGAREAGAGDSGVGRGSDRRKVRRGSRYLCRASCRIAASSHEHHLRDDEGARRHDPDSELDGRQPEPVDDPGACVREQDGSRWGSHRPPQGRGLTLHSPSNSATDFICSMCWETTLTITTIGMLSSIPQIPQSQPQNSNEMKTAAGFIFAIRPVIQVVTKVPTTVAITSDAPPTRKAIEKESNCINAAIPVAAAAIPGPR